jgi:uncharacterized membrane protein YecN with MAPEG domain
MDLGLVHMPLYTGLFAAVLMILQIVLMGIVIAQRGKLNVLIGTGGDDAMEKSIRTHANLIENAPMFLIGLALIELIAGGNMWVLVMGCVFVLARISHAIGLSASAGVTPWRLIGTLGSMIPTLVAAGYLIYLVLGRI